MENSNTKQNNNKYLNTEKIIKICTNIAINFENLWDELNQLDAVRKIYHSHDKDKNVIQVYFNLYDGNSKPFTFYENGGCHTISGQSFRWKKSLPKEQWILQKSLQDGIYYYQNAYMKCGHDVNFFSKDSQFLLLIQDVINKNHLYDLPFEKWNVLLNVNVSDRKTHKYFTRHDWYIYLFNIATARNIAVVSERTYNDTVKGYKQRYDAVRNMYTAKAKGNKTQFNKNLEIYREFNKKLTARIYNSQINGKFLFTEIYDYICMGEWCTNLLSNFHKEHNLTKFNKRQLEMYKYTKMKDIIYSCSNSEIKSVFYNSYKNIHKFSLLELNKINEFYKKVIENNTELNSLKKLKINKEFQENYNYHNSPYSFNSVCKNSIPFLKKDKNGKVRRYKNYQTYINSVNFLQTKQANLMI